MPELVALDLPAGPGFVDALADGLGRPATPCCPSTRGSHAPAVAQIVDAFRPSTIVDRRR